MSVISDEKGSVHVWDVGGWIQQESNDVCVKKKLNKDWYKVRAF